MNMEHAPKGTVLVIDDCPENMQVLIAALQRCGVAIVISSQGQSALSLAIQVMPDLVLLDMRKPQLQGLTTFRNIRAHAATHDIPIIMMTSSAELAAAAEITEALDDCEVTSVDYLTSPFQANEVIARVAAHLTIQTLKRQISEQQHQNTMNFREAIEAYEKDLIVTALEHNRGNMAQTASSLDIPLRTLYRKIKHYRLS